MAKVGASTELPPPPGPDIEIQRPRHSQGSELQIGLQWSCGGAVKPLLDCSVLMYNPGALLLDACNSVAPEVLCGAIRHSGMVPPNKAKTFPGGFNEKILIDLDAIELYTPVSLLALVVTCPDPKNNAFQTQPVTSLNVQVSEVLKGKGPQSNEANPCGFCMANVTKNTGHSVLLGLIFKGKQEKSDPKAKPTWYLRQCGYPCDIPGNSYKNILPLVHQAAVCNKFTVPASQALVLKTDVEKAIELPKGEIIAVPPSTILAHPQTSFDAGAPPPNKNAGLRLTVGLGWKMLKKGDVDLDSSILLFDANDKLHDVINFHNLKSKFGGSIQHRGDNLVGGGGGDDEKIDVFLNLLPAFITQFFIVVNVYSENKMFDCVNPAHIRLLDGNDNELLRYNLNASVKAPCFVFAKVFRSPTAGWLFTSVGVGCQGRVSSEDAVRIGCLHSVITYGPTKPKPTPEQPKPVKDKDKKSQYPAVGLGLAAGAAIVTAGATTAIIAGYGPSPSTVGGLFADGAEVAGDGIWCAGESAVAGLESLGDSIGDFDPGACVDTVGDGAGDVFGAIGDFGGDAAEWTAGAAGDAWEWIGGAGDTIADGAGDAWEWMGDAGGDAAEWMGNAGEDVAEWAGGAVETAGEGIGNAAEWVADQDIGDKVVAGGAAVGGAVAGAAEEIGEFAGDAAGTIADGVGEVINEDCCKSILQFFEGIWKEVEKNL